MRQIAKASSSETRGMFAAAERASARFPVRMARWSCARGRGCDVIERMFADSRAWRQSLAVPSRPVPGVVASRRTRTGGGTVRQRLFVLVAGIVLGAVAAAAAFGATGDIWTLSLTMPDPTYLGAQSLDGGFNGGAGPGENVAYWNDAETAG